MLQAYMNFQVDQCGRNKFYGISLANELGRLASLYDFVQQNHSGFKTGGMSLRDVVRGSNEFVQRTGVVSSDSSKKDHVRLLFDV
jgi:hypothetical protein